MISMIQLPSNVFLEQKLFIQGNINSGQLLHDLIFVALSQQVSGGQPQVHLQLEAIGSRRIPFQLGLPWFALLRNFCGRWLIGFGAKVVAPAANANNFFYRSNRLVKQISVMKGNVDYPRSQDTRRLLSFCATTIVLAFTNLIYVRAMTYNTTAHVTWLGNLWHYPILYFRPPDNYPQWPPGCDAQPSRGLHPSRWPLLHLDRHFCSHRRYGWLPDTKALKLASNEWLAILASWLS